MGSGRASSCSCETWKAAERTGALRVISFVSDGATSRNVQALRGPLPPWMAMPASPSGDAFRLGHAPSPIHEAASLGFFDQRNIHVITRGNVDGIVSSSFCFAVHPDARVSYVPSATSAVDLLRKDLSTRHFYLVDIGLTPKLIKTLNLKGRTAQRVTLIDHHQQTAMHAHELGPHVEAVIGEGGSAASVALDHFVANPGLAYSHG